MNNKSCDVLIVGSGVAGLICSLELPEDKKVILIIKKEAMDSNSYLAQGGISIRNGIEDRDAFIKDTLKAGHGINNLEAVKVLVDESEEASKTLINYGVNFTSKDGKYLRTREGGHSNFRILYHEDLTGKEIMESLYKKIIERKNIELIENCKMVDLIEENNKIIGVIAKKNNNYMSINSIYTVLATGGIGGIFKNTTSFPHIKGDSISIAYDHNVKLKDISYVQIHPTSLYEEKKGRRFLISESVRGEGALLFNHRNNRFVDELKPRDVVSKEIFKEMRKENVDFQWLSMKPIKSDIENRFPNIYKYLLSIGINPKREFVPIVPAHHYTMGGIMVDLNGKTSKENLYAIGEVSCTGVHGKNRLASNSLLECVVFGKRAAKDISKRNDSLVDFDLDKIKFNELNDDDSAEIIRKRIEEDEFYKVM